MWVLCVCASHVCYCRCYDLAEKLDVLVEQDVHYPVVVGERERAVVGAEGEVRLTLVGVAGCGHRYIVGL